jgi:ferritin-like metal-binding protein YciE
LAVRTPQSELVEYLEDAVAMEQAVARMLQDMLPTTEEPELRAAFERHIAESERHEARMRGRLEAHGEGGESRLKGLAGQLGALVKGALDVSRDASTARNARDAYAGEHLEIVSYELLERVARMAGDDETAQMARRNRDEDQAMADAILSTLDRVAVAGMREGGALLGGATERPNPLGVATGV